MEVKIALEDLKSGLYAVSATLGSNDHGHEGIRIFASKKKDKVKLTTANGIHHTEVLIPAKIKTAGKTVIKGDKLIKYVSKLDAKEITLIQQEDNSIQMKHSRGKQTFIGFAADQFPEVPKFSATSKFEIAGKMYRGIIESTANAAADKSDTRPIIEGIHFKSNGKKLVVTATDSHLMSHVSRKVKAPEMNLVLDKKFLLRSMRTVKDDDKVIIKVEDDNRVAVQLDNITYYSPVLAGEYPDVDRLTAGVDKTVGSVIVEQKDLIGLLERAVIGIDPEDKLGHVGILQIEKDKLILNGAFQTGKFHEYIEANTDGKIKFDIGIDAKKLLTVIKMFKSDIVNLAFIDKLSPIFISPEGKKNHLGIVLPVRIGGQ